MAQRWSGAFGNAFSAAAAALIITRRQGPPDDHVIKVGAMPGTVAGEMAGRKIDWVQVVQRSGEIMLAFGAIFRVLGGTWKTGSGWRRRTSERWPGESRRSPMSSSEVRKSAVPERLPRREGSEGRRDGKLQGQGPGHRRRRLYRLVHRGGAAPPGLRGAGLQFPRAAGARDSHETGTPRTTWLQNAEFVPGDVRDREAVVKALDGVDFLYTRRPAVGVPRACTRSGATRRSTAWAGRPCWTLVNTPSVRDRLRKMVVASSMSIYGEGG